MADVGQAFSWCSSGRLMNFGPAWGVDAARRRPGGCICMQVRIPTNLLLRHPLVTCFVNLFGGLEYGLGLALRSMIRFSSICVFYATSAVAFLLVFT